MRLSKARGARAIAAAATVVSVGAASALPLQGLIDVVTRRASLTNEAGDDRLGIPTRPRRPQVAAVSDPTPQVAAVSDPTDIGPGRRASNDLGPGRSASGEHRSTIVGKRHPHGPRESFAPDPGDKVFRIMIPAIGVDEAVYQGVDAPVLARGPGHYPTCGAGFPLPYCSHFEEVWPGQRGRVVIGGHRTMATRPFLRLGALRAGDTIFIDSRWGNFVYRMTGRRIVGADDRTIIVPGIRRRELVLVTCHPKFSTAQRMTVFAELDVRREPAVPHTRTAWTSAR